MAQLGFPWQETPQNTAGSSLLSNGNDAGQSWLNIPDQQTEMSNRSHSTPGLWEGQAHNVGIGKMRAASLPTSASGRTHMKTMNETQSRPRRSDTRPAVRTIPPWVRSAEEDDLTPDPSSSRPPDSPNAALIAQHNHTPASGKQYGYYPAPSGEMRPQRISRWVTFAKVNAYPKENFDGEKVANEWLNEHLGSYSKKWLADRPLDDPENGNDRYRAFQKKRRVWYKRAQFTILRNPFVPLAFRLIVFVFALIALSLGTVIYRKSKGANASQRVDYIPGPSAEMAIIIDAIALVFLAYITYDEYFSKPLGLRSARAKVRLILLDLFFIIFQSANLALAFESTAIPDGACKTGNTQMTDFQYPDICKRAKGLSAVLLISLVAWLLTFSVSVLRLVERMG